MRHNYIIISLLCISIFTFQSTVLAIDATLLKHLSIGDVSSIAVDSDGNIHVNGDSCIRKYSPDGVLLKQYGSLVNYPIYEGLTASTDGNYLYSRNGGRVTVFSKAGVYINEIKVIAADVACDTAGNIYVLLFDGSIAVYDSNCNFMKTINLGGVTYALCFEIDSANIIYVSGQDSITTQWGVFTYKTDGTPVKKITNIMAWYDISGSVEASGSPATMTHIGSNYMISIPSIYETSQGNKYDYIDHFGYYNGTDFSPVAVQVTVDKSKRVYVGYSPQPGFETDPAELGVYIYSLSGITEGPIIDDTPTPIISIIAPLLN